MIIFFGRSLLHGIDICIDIPPMQISSGTSILEGARILHLPGLLHLLQLFVHIKLWL